MESKKIVFLILLMALFNGCAYSSKKLNDTFREKSLELPMDSNNTLVENIKEKKVTKKYISTKSKTLSESLAEIGRINNQNYLLEGEDFSLEYVPNYKYISDINTLTEYVGDTTNKTLVIEKNKFIKNRVKVVRAIEKEELKKNLEDITFSLIGQDIDLRVALQRFSKKTNFSIIFTDSKQQSGDANNAVITQSNSDFKSELISFNGVNALQFLNYMKKSLNLYVDIDYKNRLISLGKYKLKTLPILVVNRNITKDGNSVIQSTEGGAQQGTEGSIQTKIEFGVYESLMDTIKEVVDSINKRSGDNNLVSVDKNTGIVSIYATSSAMQVLENSIKKFNKSYNISGMATLSIYELIVNNGITIGSDFKYFNGSTDGTSSYGATTNVTQTLANSINILNKNLAGTKGIDMVAKSISKLGYIAKRIDYGIRFRNHVPSSIRELRETNYVKNSNTNTTSGAIDSTTTTSTETEKIVAGAEVLIIPKIFENTISLYLSISDTTIESITKETFGTTEINIPITKPRSIDDEFIMQNGESRFIRSITLLEDADKYNGLIPIKDFIIGGEKEKSLVRKELVYVLSVELNK